MKDSLFASKVLACIKNQHILVFCSGDSQCDEEIQEKSKNILLEVLKA